MAFVQTTDSLEAALVRAVQAEADRLREKAIQVAVAAFEVELRERILAQAVNITSFYDLRRDEGRLVLTVRTP